MGKKASSKIEETVIRLKEKQDDALAEVSKVQDLEKKIASVIEAEDLVSKILMIWITHFAFIETIKGEYWISLQTCEI